MKSLIIASNPKKKMKTMRNKMISPKLMPKVIHANMVQLPLTLSMMSQTSLKRMSRPLKNHRRRSFNTWMSSKPPEKHKIIIKLLTRNKWINSVINQLKYYSHRPRRLSLIWKKQSNS